ncbi:hypothetical protein O3P69_010895 [Scylla paramamosain]|uniref:Uncharacterized protein n=1 Tax=Scylla paramamosain TaxID=85552 RepID=A0AAW0TH24_SCYPA
MLVRSSGVVLDGTINLLCEKGFWTSSNNIFRHTCGKCKTCLAEASRYEGAKLGIPHREGRRSLVDA